MKTYQLDVWEGELHQEYKERLLFPEYDTENMFDIIKDFIDEGYLVNILVQPEEYITRN